MATPPRTGPVMLVVMDGWGLRKETAHNAVHLAKKPNYDRLVKQYPFTQLITCGTDVGLPKGTMGNSEVGHLNIGAGRVVWQEVMRISNAIADLSFFKNAAFISAIEHAKLHHSRLHLFGLISGAFVHSCEEHYFALLRMARQYGLTRERVVLHLFTDGRDTPPRSAVTWIGDVQRKLDLYDTGVVGTVIGRYYAMDRDKRWDRVKLAYDAMVFGKAEFTAASALEAVNAAHARADRHPPNDKTPAEADEFIRPTVVLGADGQPQGLIRDNDALISFNHRSDRPREIIRALLETDFEEKTKKDPTPGFTRQSRPQGLYLVTMSDYRAGFNVPVAFDSKELAGTIAAAVSAAGLKQYHTAETEKYPHVTFFFNGGREAPFPGEERYMANSPKVATYDLQPEMTAPEVTKKACEAIRSGKYAFFVLNYANGDMVGHTGVEAAAIKAIEAVDAGVGEIVKAILDMHGDVILTADHGNAEQMWDDVAHCPHTAHTTNPVPCILVSERFKHAKLLDGGRLADLAPTLMFMLGLPVTKEMDGRNLIQA